MENWEKDSLIEQFKNEFNFVRDDQDKKKANYKLVLKAKIILLKCATSEQLKGFERVDFEFNPHNGLNLSGNNRSKLETDLGSLDILIKEVMDSLENPPYLEQTLNLIINLLKRIKAFSLTLYK